MQKIIMALDTFTLPEYPGCIGYRAMASGNLVTLEQSEKKFMFDAKLVDRMRGDAFSLRREAMNLSNMIVWEVLKPWVFSKEALDFTLFNPRCVNPFEFDLSGED